MIREGQYLEFTERLDDSFSLRVVINYEKHEYFNNMLGYFVEILLMKDGKASCPISYPTPSVMDIPARLLHLATNPLLVAACVFDGNTDPLTRTLEALGDKIALEASNSEDSEALGTFKPSDVKKALFGTVWQNYEKEVIATNILKLSRKRSKDRWLPFTWEDYVEFCTHRVSVNERNFLDELVRTGYLKKNAAGTYSFTKKIIDVYKQYCE